jgi:hypothetical protein
MVNHLPILKLAIEERDCHPSSPVQNEALSGCRLRLSCVLGMLSSLEVKVLCPT